MKKTDKSPALVLSKGQVWKTDLGYIEIWDIGKSLIDYKMMKEPGQKAVRTYATTIDILRNYLQDHSAVLVS